MLLIIFSLVLILGIAMFQSVQGVFSALIMALLTLASAVVAFDLYEPLARSMLYSSQPEYADGIMLLALFFITLLALRLLYDHFLRGNIMVAAWPDRIVGGLFGLFTGIVCVGVLTLAMQMLPWGASIMGYTPYNDSLTRDSNLAPFYPDKFVLNLMDKLSVGSMASDPAKAVSTLHDDLPLELFCARNTGKDKNGVSLNGSTAATGESLTIKGVYLPPEKPGLPAWADVPLNPLLSLTAPSKVVIIRCQVAESANALDSDKQARFVATHFRLVTQRKDADGKIEFHSHYPVAYLTYHPTKTEKFAAGWAIQTAEPKDPVTQLNPLAKLVVFRPAEVAGKGLAIDWVYRLPPEETPDTVVFRRTVQAAVPKETTNDMPPQSGALGIAKGF